MKQQPQAAKGQQQGQDDKPRQQQGAEKGATQQAGGEAGSEQMQATTQFRDWASI
ncbi:MAG: hypothetical protein JSR87_00760 [Proteobacteria bacterium]|nr:hypothetical protein [Pseudomonadota bacterium]MBS0572418.1 hypothetical protein [Pseudomonadota bacterium]